MNDLFKKKFTSYRAHGGRSIFIHVNYITQNMKVHKKVHIEYMMNTQKVRRENVDSKKDCSLGATEQFVLKFVRENRFGFDRQKY